jgi:peptide deformylase
VKRRARSASQGAVPVSIRQLGDPVLRTRTDPVTDFGPALAQLVDLMFSSMYAARGVGLAANQIGVGLSIFVMDCQGVKAVVANPRLTWLSEETITDLEGCLSVLGKNFPTARAASVTVEGQDATGAPITISGDGELARCLQHETDHLSGKLYIDRLTGEVRRQARREVELG